MCPKKVNASERVRRVSLHLAFKGRLASNLLPEIVCGVDDQTLAFKELGKTRIGRKRGNILRNCE